MLLSPPPTFSRFVRHILLVLASLAACLATAQTSASISTSDARVQGLHYVAGTNPGQKATWTFHSGPVPGWDPRYLRQVTWSVDGTQAKFTHAMAGGPEGDMPEMPPGAYDFTYTATGVGKHTVTVQVDYNYSPGPGTTTVAAIGGSLGFIRLNGELSTWSRDNDGNYSPWYLQYFGFGPNDLTYSDIDQAPQMFSVVAPSQPTTGTTTYAWSISGSGVQIKGTPTSNTTSVTVGANAATGMAQVKLSFHYVDSTDSTLVGDANDDTDEVPGDDGQVHSGMYHFHSHAPSSLSQLSKTPLQANEAGGNPSDSSVGPWVPPHPLGYGYGDKYQYKLLDADGGAMPAVYVKEDVAFDDGTPPPPMALWQSLLSPAGNLNSVDKISLTGLPTNHPSTGTPILSGTHRYKGGIKKWSESRGRQVRSSTLKIWSDSTQN